MADVCDITNDSHKLQYRRQQLLMHCCGLQAKYGRGEVGGGGEYHAGGVETECTVVVTQ